VTSRAYLDHASSSPLRPAVVAAMQASLLEHVADPGRVHTDGHVTRVAIEAAREQVAALVHARPREVVFTSGGTEAVNAAVHGAVRRDPARTAIVTSAVEHSSVLTACRREAGPMTVVGVDELGRYDVDGFTASLGDTPALVSVQLANHEVGTVQPVGGIIEAARARGALVHVDACAAIGYHPIDFAALDADLLSVAAHTWGGPKGVGALLIRRGLRIPPLIVGGSQERARRAGIENVPAIVGFGVAAAELGSRATEEWARQREWQHRTRTALTGIDGIRFHGPADGLPNVVCCSVDDVEAEPILLALDQRGVSIHSGSACASETLEPSPVLEAMGAPADQSLRISLGWSTTDDDVHRLLSALPGIIESFRRLRTP
jgi:cysteine desulfurase